MYGRKANYVLKRFQLKEGVWSRRMPGGPAIGVLLCSTCGQRVHHSSGPGHNQNSNVTCAKTAGRYLTPTPGSPPGCRSHAGLSKGQTPSNADTRVKRVTNRVAGWAIRSLVSQEGKNDNGELIWQPGTWKLSLTEDKSFRTLIKNCKLSVQERGFCILSSSLKGCAKKGWDHVKGKNIPISSGQRQPFDDKNQTQVGWLILLLLTSLAIASGKSYTVSHCVIWSCYLDALWLNKEAPEIHLENWKKNLGVFVS